MYFNRHLSLAIYQKNTCKWSYNFSKKKPISSPPFYAEGNKEREEGMSHWMLHQKLMMYYPVANWMLKKKKKTKNERLLGLSGRPCILSTSLSQQTHLYKEKLAAGAEDPRGSKALGNLCIISCEIQGGLWAHTVVAVVASPPWNLPRLLWSPGREWEEWGDTWLTYQGSNKIQSDLESGGPDGKSLLLNHFQRG